MILFSLSLLLLICSLCIFFDLQYTLLWKISLGATEYGHCFILLPLVIALASRFSTPLSSLTTTISILTIALLLFPDFLAMPIARSLPERPLHSFGKPGEQTSESVPFGWDKLLFGISFPEVPPEREVYAHHGGEEQYLQFFRSSSRSPSPCIVVLHTGGWDSGSPDEFKRMNEFLASRGYAVASISYRFAPKWKWPAQKEDALGAVSFLKKNSVRLGIDPLQFVLFGRSAGGQIAEATAYSANDPAIKGCIAFYAPADMNFAYEHLSPEPDILDSKMLMENFLGGSQNDARNNYDDASPYDHVSSSTVPTLLIHGARDPLTWYKQSERLSKKLDEFSVPNLYVELPWGTHAFDYNFDGPGGQISRYAVEQFLSLVLTSSGDL